MVQEQHGSANRDQVNVAGDGTFHIYYGTTPAAPPEADDDGDVCADPADYEAPAGGMSTGAKVFIGIVIVGVLLLCKACFGDKINPDPFPKKGDPWPKGPTVSTVLAPVADVWRSCAREVVLKPANCPQSVGDAVAGVADVRWTLHGDPVDGAEIVYRNKDGFHVLGSVVMSASYRTSFGPGFKAQSMYYLATVEWRDNTAKVTSLQRYDRDPARPIRKHDPHRGLDVVKSAVGQAFQRCVDARLHPMPPGCPGDHPTSSGDRATWTINGDPLVNTRVKFDPAFGLVHVVGSYSLTVRYSVPLLGETTESHSGTYDASISFDGGTPTVVEIVSQ